jgi:DNA polymerase I-like protein with 3'-5' exonuclease and polymerase domains
MVDSLWGEEFSVVDSKQQTKNLVDKIGNPKSPKSRKMVARVKSNGISIEDKIKLIAEEVYRILGSYKDRTQVIRTKDELKKYFDAIKKNKIVAIDTETNNSLDPITCKIMGLCLYTPGQKNAYVPINHVNLYSGERLDWQLTEEDIAEFLSDLEGVSIIMHNGKFDYQVIKCTTGVELKVYWDTLIGARLLNENELAGLKDQYTKKIDPSIVKYDIESLFDGMEYAIFSPELFALYAATDSFMTFELYLWQKNIFDKPDHQKLLKLFMEVEMPIMEVASDMELYGIEIDKEYAKRLSLKYHKMLEDVQHEIDLKLETYKDEIARWRLTPEANVYPIKKKKDGTESFGKSKNMQLKDPPELTSPTQFAILLYDVLKAPSVDDKSPRGTGEDILKKIEEKTGNPLCSLVLKQRGIDKLIGTYIDKLPECVNEKTGRLHAHFNQLGTETGRFSSSDPNLQNIPSHEKAIRMMFKASDGYVMVGSDFSLQNVG